MPSILDALVCGTGLQIYVLPGEQSELCTGAQGKDPVMVAHMELLPGLTATDFSYPGLEPMLTVDIQ